MTEEDLIKRFRRILIIIHETESRIKYADDPNQLMTEIEDLNKEKETIIEQLKSVGDKSLTHKKTESVSIMINELYKKFSRKDYPHNFSRDQSMIVHAYILIKIAEDISYALDYNLIVSSDYYLEIDSDFSCDEIVRILKTSIDYLNNNRINDYIELFEFTRSVQRQIVQLDKDCGRINIH